MNNNNYNNGNKKIKKITSAIYYFREWGLQKVPALSSSPFLIVLYLVVSSKKFLSSY